MLVAALLSLAFGVSAAEPKLQLNGTELVIGEGEKQVRGTEVVGARLNLPQFGQVRVASAELDRHSRFADIWLYSLVQDTRSVCIADVSGDTRATFYSGYVDTEQRYTPDRERISLSCVSAVPAKCLRWGYVPWRTAPIGGGLLAGHFDSCLRLARADYGGDGQPHTRNGTAVDIYEQVGIQRPESRLDGFSFEAGWAPHGAVCVHHTRVSTLITADDLALTYPRLITGASCDEETASAAGALLFNRSRQETGLVEGL